MTKEKKETLAYLDIYFYQTTILNTQIYPTLMQELEVVVEKAYAKWSITYMV